MPTKARLVIPSALLALPLLALGAAGASHVEKRLADRLVKLPQLPGYAPACEENAQFAQRAQLMTPKTSVLLTCFVQADRWRDFLAGKATSLYPALVVTVQLPQPGGDFTPQEFEKLRSAAYKQLGKLITNAEPVRQQLSAQDRQLAASGVAITRRDYQQSMQGFFEAVGAPPTSFSYLVIRSSSVAEGGVARPLHEANAVSNILHAGRIVGLNVVDQTSGEVADRRVQDLTAEWLRAFRALNEGPGANPAAPTRSTLP